MRTDELNIAIADLETYKELFLYGGYIPKEDRWFLYEISHRKNDIGSIIKQLKDEAIDYYVMFNGVNFDGQVLQYILDTYEDWPEYTWKQLVDGIYQFSQDIISNQNYEIAPPYKEQYMDIKIIDMFLILHMDNKNRRTSLKWCEFSMDEDIEELPIPHWKENLTSEEIEDVITYWRNDIRATQQLYKYCIGDCDHADYKGKNKVQLRIDLIKEMKLPDTAINWNDVKIGAELNKKTYLELSGITTQKLWDKVKNRKTKTKFLFKDCYPKYTKFKTKEFQQFFKKVGDTVVNLNQKQEFPFTYNGTNYMFAKGGGHSAEKPRMFESDDEWIIYDGDVGSMYPNIIRKRNIYPAHLGSKWNEAYISNIAKRLEAKKKYKETGEKIWDNIQETYKLVLNGCFGRLIDRYDWQYDPYAGMQVTIGGQIDIYMLAESLEIASIHVISLNTDGVTVYMKRDMLEQYHQICKEWEKIVGNDTMGNLEYVEYKKLIQLSVNDYIAVKADGGVKKKGDFLTSYELHKNKSKSVIPYMLEQYYIHGIAPEESIKQCKDIYMFGIAKKASKDYSHVGTSGKGETNQYKRLIRYYCCTKDAPNAEKLWKIKNPESEKTGPEKSHCEASSNYQVVFNKKPDTSNWESLCIDYEWYLTKTRELIGKIQPHMKQLYKQQITGQQSLW